MVACAIVICFLPVPMMSVTGLSSMSRDSRASASMPTAFRPPTCAAIIGSRSTLRTVTPCRASTVMPWLASWADLGIDSSSNTPRTASSAASSPTCSPVAWPTGTYQAAFASFEKAMPTRSPYIGFMAVDTTSNANPSGESRASTISRRPSGVSTTVYRVSRLLGLGQKLGPGLAPSRPGGPVCGTRC